MIEGFDISNNNPWGKIENYLKKNDPKFCFLKASEGETYWDRKMPEYHGVITREGIVPGFYHFARGNGNSAVKEAENFLDAVRDFAYNGALLALDIEGKALLESTQWVREWIDMVESEYDGKVIIYIQRSAFHDKKPAFKDNGLWLASWGDNLKPPYVLRDYQIAFWQDGIRDGLDHDYFFGDINQLLKYKCYRKKRQ